MKLNSKAHFSAVRNNAHSSDMAEAFNYPHSAIRMYQTSFNINGQIRISGIDNNNDKYNNKHFGINPTTREQDNTLYNVWEMCPKGSQEEKEAFLKEELEGPRYKVVFFKDKGDYFYKGIYYIDKSKTTASRIYLSRLPETKDTDIELGPINSKVDVDLKNLINGIISSPKYPHLKNLPVIK